MDEDEHELQEDIKMSTTEKTKCGKAQAPLLAGELQQDDVDLPGNVVVEAAGAGVSRSVEQDAVDEDADHDQEDVEEEELPESVFACLEAALSGDFDFSLVDDLGEVEDGEGRHVGGGPLGAPDLGRGYEDLLQDADSSSCNEESIFKEDVGQELTSTGPQVGQLQGASSSSEGEGKEKKEDKDPSKMLTSNRVEQTNSTTVVSTSKEDHRVKKSGVLPAPPLSSATENKKIAQSEEIKDEAQRKIAERRRLLQQKQATEKLLKSLQVDDSLRTGVLRDLFSTNGAIKSSAAVRSSSSSATAGAGKGPLKSSASPPDDILVGTIAANNKNDQTGTKGGAQAKNGKVRALIEKGATLVRVGKAKGKGDLCRKGVTLIKGAARIKGKPVPENIWKRLLTTSDQTANGRVQQEIGIQLQQVTGRTILNNKGSRAGAGSMVLPAPFSTNHVEALKRIRSFAAALIGKSKEFPNPAPPPQHTTTSATLMPPMSSNSINAVAGRGLPPSSGALLPGKGLDPGRRSVLHSLISSTLSGGGGSSSSTARPPPQMFPSSSQRQQNQTQILQQNQNTTTSSSSSWSFPQPLAAGRVFTTSSSLIAPPPGVSPTSKNNSVNLQTPERAEADDEDADYDFTKMPQDEQNDNKRSSPDSAKRRRRSSGSFLPGPFDVQVLLVQQRPPRPQVNPIPTPTPSLVNIDRCRNDNSHLFGNDGHLQVDRAAESTSSSSDDEEDSSSTPVESSSNNLVGGRDGGTKGKKKRRKWWKQQEAAAQENFAMTRAVGELSAKAAGGPPKKAPLPQKPEAPTRTTPTTATNGNFRGASTTSTSTTTSKMKMFLNQQGGRNGPPPSSFAAPGQVRKFPPPPQITNSSTTSPGPTTVDPRSSAADPRSATSPSANTSKGKGNKTSKQPGVASSNCTLKAAEAAEGDDDDEDDGPPEPVVSFQDLLKVRNAHLHSEQREKERLARNFRQFHNFGDPPPGGTS
ncbi:unnamed protein product [Amoebophrya sp. A25]|nr:unnamed protein product [Amoebophrya sp. A25]|eukprot:GSA25T00010708001.1